MTPTHSMRLVHLTNVLHEMRAPGTIAHAGHGFVVTGKKSSPSYGGSHSSYDSYAYDDYSYGCVYN